MNKSKIFFIAFAVLTINILAVMPSRFIVGTATAASMYKLEIPLGDYVNVDNLPQYIVQLHKFGIAFAAILAVIVMMIGSFIWLASAGSSSMVTTGKEYIIGAVVGLVIALFSYFILSTINPKLVNLTTPGIEGIDSTGDEKICCLLLSNTDPTTCKEKSGIMSGENCIAKISTSQCLGVGGTKTENETDVENCGIISNPNDCNSYTGDAQKCDDIDHCFFKFVSGTPCLETNTFSDCTSFTGFKAQCTYEKTRCKWNEEQALCQNL